jgi:TolB-like protein
LHQIITFTTFQELNGKTCTLLGHFCLTKQAGMKNSTFTESDTLFSVQAVEEELERIFRDPHFTESAILKKFLSFIVQETIHGRSNCLKEYTIAVNVLEKPLSFNPQENGIVRIHAGRLRRALTEYYSDMGRNDQIVITIPKGKYVPVFANRSNPVDAAIIEREEDDAFSADDDDNLTLAILPFSCTTKTGPARSFAEGLCLQLNSTLMHLDQISVIAYQAVKNLAQSHPDYRELGSAIGFNYIITGGVQFLRDRMRVNLQMIECNSYKQTWSQTFERKLTKSNLFEIEDEICQHVINYIERLANKKYGRPKMLMNSHG